MYDPYGEVAPARNSAKSYANIIFMYQYIRYIRTVNVEVLKNFQNDYRNSLDIFNWNNPLHYYWSWHQWNSKCAKPSHAKRPIWGYLCDGAFSSTVVGIWFSLLWAVKYNTYEYAWFIVPEHGIRIRIRDDETCHIVEDREWQGCSVFFCKLRIRRDNWF